MSEKKTGKDQGRQKQRPVDLKYGQTASEAGEYQCTRCGQVQILGKDEVAEPCRGCGGHFYYARFHLRK